MLIYSEQSPFLQYVPLPLFFAEDKLSFYKVMSDSQGYKHIHYVKDVSIFLFIIIFMWNKMGSDFHYVFGVECYFH